MPECRDAVAVDRAAPQRRAGAPERRRALFARGEIRFGRGWQEWDTAEWLRYFERREQTGEQSLYEIFDFAVAPRNARADAAGMVGTSDKLILIRDQSCPECGRPLLALCYRQNGESPQQMREAIQRQEHWPAWHAAHP